MIRRFSRGQMINHGLMLVTFAGLVLTGFPQMFPRADWARGVVLIFGGVTRIRAVHHFLGTVMAIQLVWHGLELLWLHVVRRHPLTMLPKIEDARHFLQQMRFNLGLAKEEPRYDRYSWPEKLEYLSLVWGTMLMVGTGIMMLYPVRFGLFLPGQIILAAKAAHGGEATLALLAIVTWHAYFVHIKHWNTAMFTGHLGEELYAEEHPQELERILAGDVPRPAAITSRRFVGFVVVSLVVVLLCAALVIWLRAVPVAIETVTPVGVVP